MLLSGGVVPGAGAFEIYAWQELQKFKDEIKGKSRLGVQAYAEALLVIPKIIGKLNLKKKKKKVLFFTNF